MDAEFRSGAQAEVNRILEQQVELCILQSRSPSCGVKQIYDGTFTGQKIPGQGIFAKMLCEKGIKVMDVEDLP